MNERLLKYLIYIAGAVCLYAFLAVRILPMFNAALVENRSPEYFEFTKYGEQYYSNYIKHFREVLPYPKYKYRLSDRNPNLDEADLIAFGDSFFDFNRQETVAERLHDSLGVAVHAVRAWYPLDYLHSHNYQKGERKTIIFQVVERNLHDRFIEPHDLNWKGNDYMDVSKLSLPRRIKHWIFDVQSEQLYSILLSESYLTRDIYSTIATVKFDLFDYMAPRTPVYSLDNRYNVPFLFYDITVNDAPTGFYFPHSNDLIRTYCDNLVDLKRQLKERYNLDLLFMPVPNKYTMYYKIIHPEDTYNNFLPRFYSELDRRQINYVNLYDPFLAADTLLYYGTDSHWNKNGVDIAVEKLLKKLEN